MNRVAFVSLLLSIAFFSAKSDVHGQEWAKKRLEESPRHQEWVELSHGNRKVQSFVMYPEVKDKAPAVIVIHEIFGLSEWVKSMCDQFAEIGCIAIAPDLISGMGKDGGGTESFEGREMTRAVSTLPPDQVTADLNAAYEYLSDLPACNGKVIVAGFCWGGTQSFRYAANNSKLKAAMVFYGSGPDDKEAIERIACPILGFYGENDNRVNATIERSKDLMQAAGKQYDPVIYPGAGHGFMRAGEEPEANVADKTMYAANRDGRKAAWDRIRTYLGSL